MATTKDEFIQSAVNEMGTYPTLAKRMAIGDPLISQGLASMAAMLADLSNQVEVTTGEVYLKARDVTVLADASVKGVLPFGKACMAQITVTNLAATALSMQTGRLLRDASGRVWRVTTGAQIAAGATGTIVAKQVEQRVLTHTVAVNQPFYTIELAEPDIGFIAEVTVTGWTYTPEFCNVLDGDLIYHIQTDENQVISLVFGVDGLAGKQPPTGSQLTITIYDTEGEITLPVGMAFYTEYNMATEKMTMALSAVTQAGSAPMSVPVMREVCSYPGIYNESAVYQSNFDFLVRKKIGAVTFLHIWNERDEEAVRPAIVDNMNRHFIAAIKDGTDTATLHAEIIKILKEADDSYRFASVEVVEKAVPLQIRLLVPSTFDAAATKQAVRSLILEEYGRASAWAKRGNAKLLKKDIYDLARKNVPALTQRVADLSIDLIGDDSTDYPEHFRYVTEESLVVDTETAD